MPTVERIGREVDFDDAGEDYGILVDKRDTAKVWTYSLLWTGHNGTKEDRPPSKAILFCIYRISCWVFFFCLVPDAV